MMQFVVVETEPIAPVVQEPYQYHVHLQGDGKWNLDGSNAILRAFRTHYSDDPKKSDLHFPLYTEFIRKGA